MRISLGILACNEAAVIGRTIEALFRQTLFTVADDRVESIEVVCVPNGCTDGTATLAQETSRRACAGLHSRPVCCRVYQIAQADKANAWNQYIHELSDQSADYVLLVDADVLPVERDVFAKLIQALEDAKEAQVATPRFVKSIASRNKKTLFDRLSLALSKMTQQRPVPLCGALYCGRGRALREIWMPRNLLVEDGFLRLMILTNQFRSSENHRRIVPVPDASVEFEACTSIHQFFRHERRLVMGSTINTLLFRELMKRAVQPGVGLWVRQQNITEPDWVIKLVEKRRAEGGYWLISQTRMLHRFGLLKHFSPAAAAVRLPLALGAFLFDLPVLFAANRALRQRVSSWAW